MRMPNAGHKLTDVRCSHGYSCGRHPSLVAPASRPGAARSAASVEARHPLLASGMPGGLRPPPGLEAGATPRRTNGGRRRTQHGSTFADSWHCVGGEPITRNLCPCRSRLKWSYTVDNRRPMWHQTRAPRLLCSREERACVQDSIRLVAATSTADDSFGRRWRSCWRCPPRRGRARSAARVRDARAAASVPMGSRTASPAPSSAMRRTARA